MTYNPFKYQPCRDNCDSCRFEYFLNRGYKWNRMPPLPPKFNPKYDRYGNRLDNKGRRVILSTGEYAK
jgi:hypothetical protein